jgi:malonate-semialdehyde dehydrogenase (acetylating)/methylmalonate-semialdehyde dehydrogenase
LDPYYVSYVLKHLRKHYINDHQYGNGTAIFTNNGYTARQFAEDVQVGMVGINVPVPVPVAYQSFGGWKRSIFADIGMYGHEAVRFYTKLKTITERWFAEKK